MSSSLALNFFHLFGKVTDKIKGKLDQKLFYIIEFLNLGIWSCIKELGSISKQGFPNIFVNNLIPYVL